MFYKNKNDNSWPCSQKEMIFWVLLGTLLILIFI